MTHPRGHFLAPAARMTVFVVMSTPPPPPPASAAMRLKKHLQRRRSHATITPAELERLRAKWRSIQARMLTAASSAAPASPSPTLHSAAIVPDDQPFRVCQFWPEEIFPTISELSLTGALHFGGWNQATVQACSKPERELLASYVLPVTSVGAITRTDAEAMANITVCPHKFWSVWHRDLGWVAVLLCYDDSVATQACWTYLLHDNEDIRQASLGDMLAE